MKTIAYFILAVALVELSSAVTKEYIKKAIAAKDACAKTHNIEDGTILEFIREEKLPETENGKCAIACYMEQMNVLVDGKANAENWKADNPARFEDAELSAKADKVVDECVASESPDGKSKCEYAVDLVKCAVTKAKEMGIPKPNLSDIKRQLN